MTNPYKEKKIVELKTYNKPYVKNSISRKLKNKKVNYKT